MTNRHFRDLPGERPLGFQEEGGRADTGLIQTEMTLPDPILPSPMPWVEISRPDGFSIIIPSEEKIHIPC
jgi:hypothetical protein